MKYFFWLFIVCLILFRYFSTRTNYSDGQPLRITTTVVSEPTVYDNGQQIRVSGLKVNLPLIPELHYGDRIVIQGVVKDDKLTKAKLEEIKPNTFLLYNVRQQILEFYESNLPQPHAALISGIVLGSKKGISIGFWEELKESGTAHVVVASGMNVTLLAGFVLALLLRVLRRSFAVMLALIAVWIYCLVSGIDAPIVRASIMTTIGFIGMLLGRVNYAFLALLVSASLMLIINPSWISDLGFILSFAATASLILFERQVAKRIQFVPGVFREGLSTSLAAQIGVAPILFVSFGNFNIFSPLINAAILWTIPGITIIGSIAGIVSLVSIQLASIMLYLVYPLTWFFVNVVYAF